MGTGFFVRLTMLVYTRLGRMKRQNMHITTHIATVFQRVTFFLALENLDISGIHNQLLADFTSENRGNLFFSSSFLFGIFCVAWYAHVRAFRQDEMGKRVQYYAPRNRFSKGSVFSLGNLDYEIHNHS